MDVLSAAIVSPSVAFLLAVVLDQLGNKTTEDHFLFAIVMGLTAAVATVLGAMFNIVTGETIQLVEVLASSLVSVFQIGLGYGMGAFASYVERSLER